MTAPALNRAYQAAKLWLAKMVVLAIGLTPVSCHYELTGPALWNHHSSYAFEAWLVMWIGSLVIAIFTIYAVWAE